MLSFIAVTIFMGLFWSEDRLRCYQDALRLNGRTAEVFRRQFFESGHCELGKGAHDALTRWLKSLPKPCGLLAANDLLATEVISVARSVGIKIPEQLSVLGIDNDELACENATPTLSSIRPNFEEAGFQCAQLLAARLAARSVFRGSPLRTFSAAGIMRRQSTRRLPRANADVSKALEIIRLGTEQLREYGRPDFGDGTLVRREIELKRVVPAQGCLSGASEIVFELGRPYDVTALDFVSVRAAGAHLPKSVDVVGEDGNVVARNLVVPHADDGNVSTVPFRKVRTKRIGVRIADSDGWQLAAVRVRVPTFAGHLILREEKDNY